MSKTSTLSLTEALTRLAFNGPIPAAELPPALNQERWGIDRVHALTELIDAVHTLCNAGYSGEVKLFGKSLQPGATHRGLLREITQPQCEQFRLFAPGYDTLWIGSNKGNEFSDSFAAHIGPKGIDDVRVDRTGFKMLMRKRPRIQAIVSCKLPRLSDAKLERWWDRLSEAGRAMPQDDLHKHCVAAHPNNSVSRQRIRDLTPSRKPGPRPITPHSTA